MCIIYVDVQIITASNEMVFVCTFINICEFLHVISNSKIPKSKCIMEIIVIHHIMIISIYAIYTK